MRGIVLNRLALEKLFQSAGMFALRDVSRPVTPSK